MSNAPLVTVCIPIYNGERFLEEALISAFNQSYSSIEIIISDDKSDDDSLLIIEELKIHNQKNFDIKIYSHERLGLVQNWNFCLSRASGKYIKFLFQDDILDSKCVEKMVTLAESKPEIGMVFTPRELIVNDGMKVPFGVDILHEFWGNLQPIQKGSSLLKRRVLVKDPVNKIGEPTNVLIRKEILDKIGNFDCNLAQLVDWEMWLRIISCYDIGFINEKLARFRIHDKQATNQNFIVGRGWDDIYKIWLKVLNEPVYHKVPLSTRLLIKGNLLYRLVNTLLKALPARKPDDLRLLSTYIKKAIMS
ncbi:glycosyltransferase family 2 protein [Nostoc sp. 'Peltigera membranacea cyanobiont' 210A]|uniref:glycosyltransferase family 2 protein n=1 Tax=Nostoc sp. 'Peltigera membranacea cyanobiont' 210A TaxID=2014529 RepID=UPI00167C74D0|nr:glycosyltransferase [Nostoc sp. 'Peltigera membranacea cyanobiont' 210A]